MNKKISLNAYILLAMIILIISIIALNANARSTRKPLPHNVTLHVGQQGTQDFISYTAATSTYPTGSSFMNLGWNPSALGNVTVAHNDFSISFPHVFTVMGSSQGGNQLGVTGLTINAGLNKEEFVTPRAAYDAYVDLLERLNQQNWQNYFEDSRPRIAAEDNFRYIEESYYSVGIKKPLTYEEWQAIINHGIRSFNFSLYQDGILLSILLMQTDTQQAGEPNEPDKEQYILKIHIDTVDFYVRRSLTDGFILSNDELKMAFDEYLKHMATIRYTDEQTLREQGYRIVESYVDPDLWQYIEE